MQCKTFKGSWQRVPEIDAMYASDLHTQALAVTGAGSRVLYMEAGSRDERAETHVRGNRHSLTIDKLKCGSTYRFAIRAYNDAGTGNVSDAISVKTKGARERTPARF